jgi:hypothetical protein
MCRFRHHNWFNEKSNRAATNRPPGTPVPAGSTPGQCELWSTTTAFGKKFFRALPRKQFP